MSVNERELLERMANTISRIADDLEDEGDRVYLGSTNDGDELTDLRDEWLELQLMKGQ